MASTSKGSSRPGHGERRKRPGPPTIELKATEVAPPAAESARPEPPPHAESTATESIPSPTSVPEAEPSPTHGETVATESIQPSPMNVPEAEPAPARAEPAAPESAAPPEPLWSAGASNALHAAGHQANPYREAAEPAARRVDPEPPAAPASPETPAVTPSPSWPPSRPLLAGAAAAAIILLAAGLWGVFSSRDSVTDALSLRMALIESQLRQLAERPVPAPPDPQPMSDLAARMTAAEQAAGRIGDLPARLAAAEQALRRLDGSVATGLARLQGFEERVAKTETAPRVAAADPARDGRIAATDTAVKALDARLATLETTVRPLAEQARSATAADQALVGRASAAEAAVKVLNDKVAELGRNVEQAAQAARTAAGQATIASREATSAASGADRAVRLAFASTSLRDVVLRGEPFAADLSAVKPLVSDPARLAPLEAYAASGVPSAAALARELTALVPALAAVAAPAQRDAGVLDRLQASAERFVRIRPVNETPGADPAAVIARIEARAAAQSIDAARAELANLPADMRAPAQGWIATAEKRAAALAAAQSLARDAIAALTKE